MIYCQLLVGMMNISNITINLDYLFLPSGKFKSNILSPSAPFLVFTNTQGKYLTL